MRFDKILWPLLAAVCAAAIWAVYNHDLDVVYAYRGDSAISWVYQSFHSELFSRTFADLPDSYGSSLAMRAYLLAYGVFGIAPENFYPVFLAGEILALGAASWFLLRALFPESGPGLRLIFALLVVCSNARNMNLARFGQPLFFGIYYNYADALRISAVALFLLGKPVRAYLLMALSFACHPVIGLIGFGFLLVAGFVRKQKLLGPTRPWIGPLLFAALCASWMFATTDLSSLATNEIPRDRWFALTRFGSYHWYAWDIGVFTGGHTEMLVPFLSFLLLTFFFWRKREEHLEKDRSVLWGSLALLAMVPIGVLAGEFEWSPTLTKLALHRCNDLVIFLGLAYLMHGLWTEIREGPAWRKAYACGIAAGPFYLASPFSWIHALLFTLPGWSFSLRNRKGFALLLFGVGLAALPLLYLLVGIRVPWESPAYLSTLWFFAAIGTGAILFWVLMRFARDGGRVAAWLCSLALFLSPIPWLYDYLRDRPFVGSQMDLAKRYQETQIWARENTPIDALFMPDPTIFYGWKDFSRRSSFGNVRAWIFESWSYSSNFDAYQEGLRRFEEFGVDLGPYLKMRPSIDGSHRLIEKIAERYYEFDDSWRLRMRERYGIDYFIYKKRNFQSKTELPIAYENFDFLVVRAKPN